MGIKKKHRKERKPKKKIKKKHRKERKPKKKIKTEIWAKRGRN